MDRPGDPSASCLDGEMIEFICLENQQFESPYLKGQT